MFCSNPKELGLDDAQFQLSLLPQFATGLANGQNTELHIGPLKGQGRIEDKMQEYLDEYESDKDFQNAGEQYLAARRVIDMMRATYEFEDPYALAVFYHFLMKQTDGLNDGAGGLVDQEESGLPSRIRFMRTKNKFATGKTALQRTNILMNFEMDHPRITGLVVSLEIQLTLRDHYAIKGTLHLYYDIERATFPKEILRSDLFAKKRKQISGGGKPASPPTAPPARVQDQGGDGGAASMERVEAALAATQKTVATVSAAAQKETQAALATVSAVQKEAKEAQKKAQTAQKETQATLAAAQLEASAMREEVAATNAKLDAVLEALSSATLQTPKTTVTKTMTVTTDAEVFDGFKAIGGASEEAEAPRGFGFGIDL